MTKTPLIIAHRGASAHAPENTLSAFEWAIRDGADGIEFDVWRCGSGEVVVTHNRELKILTGRSGNLEKTPLKILKTMDFGYFKGSQFRNERIPTLAEVLDLASQLDLINIEIKGLNVRGNGIELPVVETILQFSLLRKVVVSSFNPTILLRLQRLNPAIRLGLLFNEHSPMPIRRAWAAPLLKAYSVHPRYAMLTPAKVAKAHQKKQKVYTWTINDSEQLGTCIESSVDGIITDDPAWARNALRPLITGS